MNNPVQQQCNKFENLDAVIGIIGLGYVGLPLALEYLKQGYRVVGFDVDPEKIVFLKAGNSYIEHIDFSIIPSLCENEFFIPTTDFSRVSDVDAVILCVPTPLDEHREPDLSYVTGSVEHILPYLKKYQIIALESTTYPGTTEEELKPRIERRGFEIGEDYFLVYSPEREDPNNPDFSTRTIPKICGAGTENCMQVGQALYGKVIDKIIPVSSTQAAEMTKILENTFRAVNIALVNELKQVAEKMDIDIFEVIRAAATKPFGFMPFYPGPGLGGHCIPIDPFYLTWKAREFGLSTKFIELAGEVNVSMPDYVVSKTMEALNTVAKPIRGSKLLVLGLSYKKNVDDVRESPSVELIKKFDEMGAHVSYSDPHVAKFPKMRKHNRDMQSVDLSLEVLKEYDCVILSTNHDRFDYELIKQHSNLIIDTRGVYQVDNVTIFRA